MITSVAAEWRSGVQFGRLERFEFDAPDGARLEAWLQHPAGFPSDERLPLILHIHGGPHWPIGLRFNMEFRRLAEAGYRVLYLNPRGALGYGNAHAQAREPPGTHAHRYPIEGAPRQAGLDQKLSGHRQQASGVPGMRPRVGVITCLQRTPVSQPQPHRRGMGRGVEAEHDHPRSTSMRRRSAPRWASEIRRLAPASSGSDSRGHSTKAIELGPR